MKLDLSLNACLRAGFRLFFAGCILQPVHAQKPPIPLPYPLAMPVNAIRVWEARAPEPDAARLSQRPLRDVLQTSYFFDGLGRPLQSVVKKGALFGSIAADWVSAQLYDELGRTSFKYLPFPATNETNIMINDGRFKQDPFQQQQRYTSKEFPGQDLCFQQTVYDPSPLMDVLKELPPGKNWVGANRGLCYKKEVNGFHDSVRIWKVTNVNNEFGNYSSAGIHPAGTLYKTILIDENGKRVIEYKDQQGKVLLKKVQEGDYSPNAHEGWLCTYFIYDETDRLRCVLQPAGVKAAMKLGWTLNDGTLLAGQCFRFMYDESGRVVRKQVPDTGPQLIVYDARGRIVLSQDGYLRQGPVQKWKYFLYDQQDRVLATGLMNSSLSREQHAALAKNSTAYPDLNGKQYEELSKVHYDDYSGMPAILPSSMDMADASFFAVPLNVSPDYILPRIPSAQLRNRITWSATRIVGTSNWISSVMFYDENGLLLQEQSNNITGGKSIRSFQYNFKGQLTRTVLRQTIKGKNTKSITVCTRNSYDDLGRKIRIEKSLDPASPMHTIATMEYDAAGRLKRKNIGTSPDGAGPIETMEYDYHIRGWVSGMNTRYLMDTSSELNHFGYALRYDDGRMDINATTINPAGKQFNGSLSTMFWKSTGDDQTRYYSFDYDAANRLRSAAFMQWPASPVDFSMGNMQYDENGNMKSLTRKGGLLKNSTLIDSLSYQYFPNSNKLMKLLDETANSVPNLGDFRVSEKYSPLKKNTVADYSYDINGNLSSDLNQDIRLVEYNHLDLPVRVHLSGKGLIQYVWSAGGKKLKRTVTDSLAKIVFTTLYTEGAVYNSLQHFTPSAGDYEDSLQYILHEEGRIRITATGAYFDYFIRDHQTNIRMVLTEQKQVDQYPAATMEPALAKTENQFYQNLEVCRIPKPAGYPDQSGNQYVAKLNGKIKQAGPSILLRVMAGDRFSIQATSWFRSNTFPPAMPADMLPIFTSMLGAALQAVPFDKIPASTTMWVDAGAAITALMAHREKASNSAIPKAYLNFLLLDEQLNPVISNNGKNSGAITAGPPDQLYTMRVTDRAITKNGYLFIFLSNETPNIEMYFDNLQVTHTRGSLLEEDHYYPFGLRMQALCSKAAGSPENALFHAGKELESGSFRDGSAPAWYDFGARMYDVQSGRWTSIDSAAENYYGLSPYTYTGNDPVNAKELDGNLFVFASGFMLNQWLGGASSTVQQSHRELIDKGIYTTWSVPVPNEKQYAPDRDFYRALPRNNGEPFGYWEEVDVNYRKAFNDNNAWYINGSFTPQSQAQDRFSEGLAAGRLLMERLDAGSISLGEDETIKIVGHSQGAAYAAGIATELAKNSKYGSRIGFVDYLSPHQPGDFSHPSGVKGRQFSSVDDIVSSAAGWKGSFLNMLNGGSKLERIDGVQETMVRYYGRGGKGGHYVGTWLNDLISFWRSIGIPVFEQ